MGRIFFRSTKPSVSTASSMCTPTTVPITRLLGSPLRSGGRSRICQSLHSRWIGDSLTRGGFTRVEGTRVSPACVASSCPAGRPALVRFICSRRSQVAMLQVNSPPSRAKASESFSAPSSL